MHVPSVGRVALNLRGRTNHLVDFPRILSSTTQQQLEHQAAPDFHLTPTSPDSTRSHRSFKMADFGTFGGAEDEYANVRRCNAELVSYPGPS